MEKIKFSGSIVVFEKNHNFDFDGKQLKVKLYDEEEARELLYNKSSNGIFSFSGGNQLPSEYLNGVVLPDNKRVIFKVQTDKYGIGNTIFFSYGTDIFINVYRYIVIENSLIQNTNTTITYSSSYFHHFLNLIPYYRTKDKNNNDDSIATILVDNKVLKTQESTFSINEYEYSIRPGFNYTSGVGIFEFVPHLVLKTDNELDMNEIWKIYNVFCNVIKFLFLRSNIYPDSFVVSSGNVKYSIYEREWDIVKEKKEKLNQPNVYDSVRWARIYKNIGTIFRYFYFNKGEQILSCLYDSRKDRYIYSKHLVSSDAAAFEHVFDELFSDFTTNSDEGSAIRDVIKDEITKLMNESSGKKREIYREIIRNLKRVQFKDKLLFALNKYETIFKDYNKKYGKESLDNLTISELCTKYRNDIDHGNDGVIIDSDSARILAYMRMITFVLYYSLFNMNNDEITGIISDLFSQ